MGDVTPPAPTPGVVPDAADALAEDPVPSQDTAGETDEPFDEGTAEPELPTEAPPVPEPAPLPSGDSSPQPQ